MDGFDTDGFKVMDYPIEYLMAIDAAGITNDMSDYEKCVCVNNYICSVAEYGVFDVSLRTKPRSTNYPISDGLDLIQYGVGTSIEYTNAFETMVTMLGIESGSYSSRFLNHAWNYVIIDGVTYFIDVTWNDRADNHYLMSTELWGNHQADDIKIWRPQDHYVEDEEQGQVEYEAANKQRQEWILEQFMKDPYKYFDGSNGSVVEIYFDLPVQVNPSTSSEQQSPRVESVTETVVQPDQVPVPETVTNPELVSIPETGASPDPSPVPAHEHVWNEHTAERQVWIPEIVTVTTYEEKTVVTGALFRCNCGYETTDSEDLKSHIRGHISANEATNFAVYDHTEIQQVPVEREEDQGHYETETYVDYHYCDCGETR